MVSMYGLQLVCFFDTEAMGPALISAKLDHDFRLLYMGAALHQGFYKPRWQLYEQPLLIPSAASWLSLRQRRLAKFGPVRIALPAKPTKVLRKHCNTWRTPVHFDWETRSRKDNHFGHKAQHDCEAQ